MSALTPDEKLRQLLGELIPEGGAEGDTLFTNHEIEELLESNGDDVERAAYEGWRVKAAKLSSLVDVSEGNSAKKFSQLRAAALDMVRVYARSSEGPTEGRTRIGRIVRAGVEWQ